MLQVFRLGVLISSSIALTKISDIFDDSEIPLPDQGALNRDRYKGVAGYLVFASIIGMVIQIILAIVRGLFYSETLKKERYTMFGIVVSIYM